MATAAAPRTSAAAIAVAVRRPHDPAAMLLHAAWMAIALGLLMQSLTAIVAVSAGGKYPALAEFVRDGVQKVTWSSFVCAGLAIGTAVSRLRTLWTGLLGVLAAPIGFVLARAAQKSTAGALGVAPPEVLSTGVFVAVLCVKAIEYGVLGTIIAWMAQKARGGLRDHVLVGLGVGATFGGVVLAIVYANAATPPPAPKLAGLAVNELLFPAGCALVLSAANTIGRRLAPVLPPNS
ncbi:MAG: hypothetical protein AB7Q17_01035 [Phycisphaerae bacterium]